MLIHFGFADGKSDVHLQGDSLQKAKADTRISATHMQQMCQEIHIRVSPIDNQEESARIMIMCLYFLLIIIIFLGADKYTLIFLEYKIPHSLLLDAFLSKPEHVNRLLQQAEQRS